MTKYHLATIFWPGPEVVTISDNECIALFCLLLEKIVLLLAHCERISFGFIVRIKEIQTTHGGTFQANREDVFWGL